MKIWKMRFEDQRLKLVSQLQALGITDLDILHAFSLVPREDFVPKHLIEYAYNNRPLPIGAGQTISQPWMVAIMLEYLDIQKHHTVLDIGTGSGYQTALLAHLAAEVCSIERIEALSLQAQTILKKQGLRNVYYRIGDGSRGWEKAYPPYKSFDRIIVSAGATEIPAALTEQIAEDGKMVIPVGPRDSHQILHQIKRKQGELIITQHDACAFVPLIVGDAQ